jgi:hypothetical protein
MSVQPSSKVSSPDLTGSTGNSGFYLQSRTKIGVLAVCLALMIGASVYSVLQPLNPKAGQAATLGNWLLYPHETNPYASLQAVHCTQGESKDYYACRLNSVAVKGAGNLAEVWAVGNFGLVLHRKAGESKWEQLTITAKGETASNPSPTPSPAPTPVRSVTPTPTRFALLLLRPLLAFLFPF